MSFSRALETYERQLQLAKQFIESQDHFLIVSHLNPDGDAISSTLAMGWLLHSMGKTFVMTNENPVPRKFSFLQGSGEIAEYSGELPAEKFAYIISVDCADFARIGQVRGSFAQPFALLNIDHHPTNDFFGQANVVRANAAATVEIIYDLAKLFDLVWDKAFADCLYTGLLTDTGGFRYANTTPNVMRIASEMLEYGVQGSVLAEHLLEKISFPQILLLQRALSRLAFSADRRLAWVIVTMEDLAELGALPEETEGIVNYPRNIDGVETGMLFKETARDEIKVSLRSAGKIDVSQIAKSLGGGGHTRAAGCTLRCTLNEAVDQVVRKVGSALA